MVALSPRFAVLAAFISLASFSTSPLSVGAAVIPRAEEVANTARSFYGLQKAFRLSQAKAMKRDDGCSKDACPEICVWLLGHHLLKRDQHPPHWSLGKDGKSYTVSHSSKHSQSHEYPRYPRNIVGRAAPSEAGTIAIVTPEEKPLGFLKIKKDEKDPQPKFLPVEATEKDATSFTLVREIQSASDAKGLQVVSVQVPPPDGSESADDWCMGYNTMRPENRNLFFAPCDKTGKGEASQRFAFNETSRDILPLSHAPQTDGSQRVLSRDDGPGKNGQDQAKVYLKFVPESEKAQDMAAMADVPTGGSSLATVTKTVTVTSTPTASLSAADINATPSANASSSASTSPTSTADGAARSGDASSSAAASSTVTNSGAAPSLSASPSASVTSTTDGAAPTAGAAGVLDVQVVQASSAPSAAPSAATSTGASSVSAAPTSTMNAQDIASSIANSSAASSPTPSGSSVAASSSSANTGSSTSAGASTPSARALYKWL